ncbi:MAG: hypothetical protein IPK60_20530 [Sandaracinaceae bacterium]|nr:hypothetical protein [Sandaracinaceae bacterium]
MTAVGHYSSGLGPRDADSDPTDDVNFDTNRLALSRTYYDERGRVWKSTRHEIDATDGSNDDNIETLTWYDRQSRRVKVDGEQLEKFAYDRLGRMTHRFLLAKVDGDEDTWAEALDVESDHVLEEHQTTYDEDGREITSARIERFSTTSVAAPLSACSTRTPTVTR